MVLDVRCESPLEAPGRALEVLLHAAPPTVKFWSGIASLRDSFDVYRLCGVCLKKVNRIFVQLILIGS